jgi:hypothetical protein
LCLYYSLSNPGELKLIFAEYVLQYLRTRNEHTGRIGMLANLLHEMQSQRLQGVLFQDRLLELITAEVIIL